MKCRAVIDFQFDTEKTLNDVADEIASALLNLPNVKVTKTDTFEVEEVEYKDIKLEDID